jgi:hypothetical protein
MPDPSPDDLVRPLSDVAELPTSWLWQYHLAYGTPALLDGDPGLGKSLVALDLCARLSRGLPWPDGSPGAGPGNCLILHTEDSAGEVRSRLGKLGADLERIFLMQEQDPAGETVRLPSQLGRLDAALDRSKARLVVMDPVVDFLDANVNLNNDRSIRRALTPLARLMEKRSCVPLMVRHLNKSRGQRALYRGSGAIGFVGACRTAWLAGRDPLDPGRCVLAQVKNNRAPLQPSLAYRVVPDLPGPPRLAWLGTSPFSADQVVGGLTRGWVRILARAFLSSLLRDGPLPAREVWERAQNQGLKERTLKRAKLDLGIRTQRGTYEGAALNYWLLPGQVLPADVAVPEGPADLEPWLAPLRQAFPSDTPLDRE